MDEYISKQSVIDYLKGYLNSIGECGADSLLFDRGQRRALINSIQDISAVKAADVQPVKQWYSVEENQPDSVGDDVLVVDSYGKYHIAYYLSGSENWMNQDTREPIKDVVKWRYLGGDSE